MAVLALTAQVRTSFLLSDDRERGRWQLDAQRAL
jgi:hypothetical protein